ncbi:MAG: GNAT family N-acetyltransferase [Bacteroidales bacterium]|nr:GNAT family N-acetyltransferase [Bacteroidales bacterium]
MFLPDDERLLKADSISNMSMLGFFAKQSIVRTLRVGDSLMAQGKSDEEWWYLSCNKPEDFEWFLDKTGKEDRFLAAINDMLLDKVRCKFSCTWTLSCIRFYLPNETIIPESSLLISHLSMADAEHIYSNSNYKIYSSVDYMREQIKQGIGSAYRQGQTLAGWVLTHDDGAMGMLHVLPNFRKRGIARALVTDLIRKIRNIGLMPYTYVEPSNTASMELVKSLGFVPDRNVHWVCMNR